MERTIIIRAGEIIVRGKLNETAAARLTWDALPLEAKAATWGEEIYFPVPVEAGLENPVETVARGDIGYWPDGRCFCLFFGPTPASVGDEIRPASAVEVIGRLEGDPLVLRPVRPGTGIRIERAAGG